MMIAKTASRNIATKAGKMSEAVLDAQASLSRLKRQDKRLRQSASRLTTMTLSVTLTCTFLIMKSLSVNFSIN